MKRSPLIPSGAFFLLVFGQLSAMAGFIIVESTFDADLDGWTKAPGSDSGSTLTWVGSGGNPGGYLRYNEAAQGSGDRVAAPAKFLGNMSAYVGGTFAMDRLTNILSNPVTANDDIRLIGGGFTLRYDLPFPGLNEWITEEVDLRHDAGWVHVGSGIAPTAGEFASVMGNLTAIHLLADFRSGVETPSFDNIRMTGIPEPGTTALLLAGCAGLYFRRHRIG